MFCSYPNVRNQTAFSLVELFIVIGVIAVLSGVALPVLYHGQQRSQSIKCLGNLRQLGTATLAYAGEHEMTLPFTSHQRSSWTVSLQPYAAGAVTFLCPADEDVRSFTYAINDYLTPNPAGAPTLDFSRLSRLDKPSQTFLFAEAARNYANTDHFHFADYHGQTIPPGVFADQVAAQRHGGSANYLFADAHAEAVSWEQAHALLRTPGNRFVDPTASDN